MTQGGYYKIRVDSDSVSREKYEEVKNENIRLKAVIETISNATRQII